MRNDLRSDSSCTGSICPERVWICPIMLSTGSDGNMRGMKKINVTPIQMVKAHVKTRRAKNLLNFNDYTPFILKIYYQ
jgi:hypothetical protein